MKMTSCVVALRPDEAEITVVADLTVTGTLAQLGHSMMKHVSKKMLKGAPRPSGRSSHDSLTIGRSYPR